MARHSCILFTVAVLGAGLAHSQSTGGSAGPKFSVTSVKPADSGASFGGLEYRPEAGLFTAKAASLDRLIAFAYDVRVHQISGGPKWRESALFHVQGKAEGPIAPGPEARKTFRLMLQALLAERFQLAVHQETRQGQVYELVVDKVGAKLKEGTSPNGGIRMNSGRSLNHAVGARRMNARMMTQMKSY